MSASERLMHAYWKGFSIQHRRGKNKAKRFSFSPLDSREGGDKGQGELKETLKLSFLTYFFLSLSLFFEIAIQWTNCQDSELDRFHKNTSIEPTQTYILSPVWLVNTNIYTQIEDSLERGTGGWGGGLLAGLLQQPHCFLLITSKENTGIEQLQGYDILTQEEA